MKKLHFFSFFTYIYADRNGNICQCQTYKCTINNSVIQSNATFGNSTQLNMCINYQEPIFNMLHHEDNIRRSVFRIRYNRN